MDLQKSYLFSKVCRKLLRSSILVGLVLLLALAPSTQARAEDTEDLLNKFGMTLGKPIKSDLEKELDSLKENLNSMRTQQLINEEYNKVMELYVSRKEELLDDILSDVTVYQNRNNVISKQISNSILTEDINSLLNADSEYKNNNHNIDSLLSVMNEYAVDYSYKNVIYDTTDIEGKLEETSKLYEDSLDTYDLGDVNSIKWIMPNDRYVTSQFGFRVDPLDSSKIRYHAGTDYRAQEGTPIMALFNGRVISCGWSNTMGYYVTVQSGDNVKYLICHCSEINVVEGQEVKQYDVIAHSGGTGSRSTGPHLHMALYLNGVTYNVDELFIKNE